MTNAAQTRGTSEGRGAKPAFADEVADQPKRIRGVPWWLMAPTLLVLFVFFVLPLIILLRYSFNRHVPGADAESAFTTENYERFFTDPFTLDVLRNTLLLGASVTVLTVILGYPVAYMLARMRSRRGRSLLYAALLIPLMTSVVVRSYGWMIILGSGGLVNSVLMGLGIVQEPLKLIYTPLGTNIALAAVLLPFMIIVLVPVIQAINVDQEQAAQSLGAGPFRAFLSVVLPRTRGGIAAGSVLVFSLAIASFATPALVGGAGNMVMALYIYQQALGQLLNWPFGAATAFVLLVLVLLLVGIQTRLIEGREKGAKDARG